MAVPVRVVDDRGERAVEVQTERHLAGPGCQLGRPGGTSGAGHDPSRANTCPAPGRSSTLSRADEDGDRPRRARPRAHRQAVLRERDVDAVPAVVDAEPQLLDLRRQRRIEAEHRAAGTQAGEAAQHEVDRAGHRAEVDALGGRAALHVGDVAVQRLLQELPRLLGLVPRQHPGVTTALSVEPCEVRAQVVVDRPLDLLPVDRGSPAGQQLAQLVAREQEQQHEHVGLLGQPCSGWAVALGLEHPVQPLDVAVALPVAVPVELLQLLVALELAQHAVGVEHDRILRLMSSPARPAPRRRIGQLVDQLLAAVRGAAPRGSAAPAAAPRRP